VEKMGDKRGNGMRRRSGRPGGHPTLEVGLDRLHGQPERSHSYSRHPNLSTISSCI
jgi:hypothetical protein